MTLRGTTRRDDDRPLILHVVEALGGGVMVGVRDYIEAADPHFRQVLLAGVRPGHDTGDVSDLELIPFAADRPGLRMLRQVKLVIDELDPDIVHAHSSWAGVVVRLLPTSRARVVYTPHCYAFERRDVGAVTRSAFRLVESILSRRTGWVVAVSPREAELAADLPGGRDRVTYVPNLAAERAGGERPAGHRPLVVAIGRLMPQKDPSWFLHFVTAARELGLAFDALWLGGGDTAAEQQMRAAGVEVSGWIAREELLRRFARADVYVHSAAWEGAPLSLLEAVSMRIPVIARDIPALRSLGIPELRLSPEAAAELLAERLGDDDSLKRMALALDGLAARHTVEAQRSRLVGAYERVLDAPRAATVVIPQPRQGSS